jgi:hypothetical protein
MRKIFELHGTVGVDGLEGVKKKFDALDKQLTSVSKTLLKTGQKIGSYVAPVAAVATGLGTAIAVAVAKTTEYADKINDLHQVTGLSTDSLQRWRYAINATGGNFESFVQILSKFQSKVPQILAGNNSSSRAFEMLGVSMTDASGKLIDINLLFPKVIEKLQGITDITTRNVIAQQLFGKSLDELGPVLGMTSDELETLYKRADEVGAVMSGKDLEAADNLGQSINELHENFSAFSRKLSVEIIPILNEVFKKIETDGIPVIGGLVDMLTIWKNERIAKELNEQNKSLQENTKNLKAAREEYQQLLLFAKYYKQSIGEGSNFDVDVTEILANIKKLEGEQDKLIGKKKKETTQNISNLKTVGNEEKKLYEQWEKLQDARRDRDVEDAKARYELKEEELRHEIEIDKQFEALQEERRNKDYEATEAIFNDKQQKIEKEKEQTIAAYNSIIDAVNQLGSIVNMYYENQAIEIDNNYEKEKERIENLNIAESEKNEMIQSLDATTAKKKKELQRKQAIIDKAIAIFNIGINTAQGIMNAWATLPYYMAIAMSIIIGALGAAQTAIVAAKPLPAAAGAFVESSPGKGAIMQVGEGTQDEVVMPLDTGIKAMVDQLIREVNSRPIQTTNNTQNLRPVTLNIGTLVADENGLKELERRMSRIKVVEAQRMGAMS